MSQGLLECDRVNFLKLASICWPIKMLAKLLETGFCCNIEIRPSSSTCILKYELIAQWDAKNVPGVSFTVILDSKHSQKEKLQKEIFGSCGWIDNLG